MHLLLQLLVLVNDRVYLRRLSQNVADDRNTQPRKSLIPAAHFVNHRDLRVVGDEGLGIGERERSFRGKMEVQGGYR